MATYLLDTNICIYLIKRRPLSVLRRFEQLAVGEVAMSVITLGELEYGACRSRNPAKAFQVLKTLKDYIPVVPCSENVAGHYADIRADLAARGEMIGNNDLWIAAYARALGWTLVSNNLREFERVKGLALENWVDDDS